MRKFYQVYWPDGTSEIASCEHQTRVALINERWGSTFEAFEAAGGRLIFEDDDVGEKAAALVEDEETVAAGPAKKTTNPAKKR